ncbi:MAG: disulfide bond formation protein B [Alphaproteobacteria bacterium]|nr:disulfide bond formation protein B [Alphaproteobacteria bacterium]
MRTGPANPIRSQAYELGGTMLFLAAVVILAALAFQYIGGYQPCPLCYQQRYAYYVGVPALFAALVVLSADQRRTAAIVFLLVSLAFLANSGLGVYQAGAEYGFWPGPAACSGGQEISTSADGLIGAIENTNVVRCDKPEWWFLGLSFAGWNALLSFAIFIGSLKAAFASPDRR